MNDIEYIKNEVAEYVKTQKNGYIKGEIQYSGSRYSVEAACDNVWEIMINKKYFISVGKLEDGTYEVFTLHYRIETKTTWKDWSVIPAEDDHLCQHKVFKSLKTAFNYALRAAQAGTTPTDINQIY